MTEVTDKGIVARRRSAFTEDVLRKISDWNSLGDFVRGNDIAVENLSAYGANLTVVNKADKDALINVPFMIVDYRFQEGDSGPFVSAVIVTKNPISINGGAPGSKFVVNDGSTGIMAQLERIEAERAESHDDEIKPLYCEHGLRKSDYVRRDENNEPILNERTGAPERAVTYYLN